MMVKTFKNSGGAGGIDYLCGKDSRTEEEKLEKDREITREGARLLSGDIDLTQELIMRASQRFEKSYTAGVLSFEESDIDEVKKFEIIESFERCLLPGLNNDEYNILWVEHRDKGRLELNFVVPRIHLLTEAHLQPYYAPVDQSRKDAWQEYINAEYKFSSPKEPARAHTTAQNKRLPAEKRELVAALDEYISEKRCENRSEVIDALKELDLEIARITPTAVSIKDPNGGSRNIRLKGEFYNENYRLSEETFERLEAQQREFSETTRERCEQYAARYQKLYERAAEANRAKYERILRNKERRNIKQDQRSERDHRSTGISSEQVRETNAGTRKTSATNGEADEVRGQDRDLVRRDNASDQRISDDYSVRERNNEVRDRHDQTRDEQGISRHEENSSWQQHESTASEQKKIEEKVKENDDVRYKNIFECARTNAQRRDQRNIERIRSVKRDCTESTEANRRSRSRDRGIKEFCQRVKQQLKRAVESIKQLVIARNLQKQRTQERSRGFSR